VTIRKPHRESDAQQHRLSGPRATGLDPPPQAHRRAAHPEQPARHGVCPAARLVRRGARERPDRRRPAGHDERRGFSKVPEVGADCGGRRQSADSQRHTQAARCPERSASGQPAGSPTFSASSLFA
jgi:hypothetical protein